MPFAIDEEKLNDPALKVLDINKPPLKSIPHAEFPRMVYLHPTDKTKEHRTKVVHSAEELKTAQKQGWRLNQHIPVAPPDPEIESGEFDLKPTA